MGLPQKGARSPNQGIKIAFPDPLAADIVKADPAYGMAYARHIESEWLYGVANSNRFIRRKGTMTRLRNFMTNEVDTAKFGDILGTDVGDKSTLSLDWNYLQIIPKYVKLVVDGFSDDMYAINAEGIDKFSQSERELYRDEMRKSMLAKDFSAFLTEQTGVDAMPGMEIPESDEELDLLMEAGYKQMKEIAIEISTKKVLDMNNWAEIGNMIQEDLATIRVGAAKIVIDSEVGIAAEYVDPITLIYSRTTNRYRDGRDRYYFAELKYYTISQVERMSNSTFTKDELKAMATKYAGILGNPDGQSLRNFDYNDLIVEVMEFCFKTNKNATYKKKYNNFGGYKLIAKTEDWTPIEGRESTKIQKAYEVWYKGSYVVASNKIYNYGLMYDTARPNSDIRKALPPYVIYELSTTSLVEKMEPLANSVQITHLKIQQLIAKTRPKGIAINLDAMENLDIGDGQVLTPYQQIKIFNADGNILYSGKSIDGEFESPIPIVDIPSGIGKQLPELVNAYNHYIRQIQDVTGINPAREGNTPEKGSLKGVQDTNIAMSNNATKHILDGYLSIVKGAAENVILRLQSLGKYGRLGAGIRDLIGERNAKILEESAEKFFWAFSIVIKMEPETREKAAIERMIEIALQGQLIEFEDAVDIRLTKNITLASQMLKVKKKKKLREAIKRQKDDQMFQSKLKQDEDNNKAAIAERTLQTTTMAAQQLADYKGQVDILLQNDDQEFQLILEDKKFYHAVELKKTIDQGKRSSDEFKENRKDKRTKLQSTQQSKMIDQRNKDLPATDFEEESFEDLIPANDISGTPVNL